VKRALCGVRCVASALQVRFEYALPVLPALCSVRFARFLRFAAHEVPFGVNRMVAIGLDVKRGP